MPPRPVLILGATGAFGGAVALALIERGDAIRVFSRDTDKARRRLGDAADIVEGDVQDRDALARAAVGCRAIVHGVNYPFHRWVPHMARATANVIDAARRAGATILFPGNVFGLGRQTDGPLDETAPNRPSSRKGSVRVQMEQALRRAASASGPRVIVLRAGDFFGPTVRNRAVDLIFRNAAKGRPMRILGRADIPHQWAYAPDAARLGLALLDLDHGLAPFEVVHFKGHVAWPMADFVGQVARRAGHSDLRLKTTPWPLLYLAGALNPALMELLEIRYLWKESVIIDDARRRQVLPDFRPTPIDAAIDATLESYRADLLKP